MNINSKEAFESALNKSKGDTYLLAEILLELKQKLASLELNILKANKCDDISTSEYLTRVKKIIEAQINKVIFFINKAKKENQDAFESLFTYEAKNMLDSQTYSKIKQKVEDRIHNTI